MTDLSGHNLWALGQLLASLKAQEAKREEAAKHKKFNDSKNKLVLPPANPKFLEFKNQVELEIRKRQNV